MKKIFALISAASLLCLCGCSGNTSTTDSDSSASDSGNHVARVSVNPIDENIYGTWSNGENGYTFQEDRFVSLPMDITPSLSFTDDGSLMMNETEIPKDMIEFDGTVLKPVYATEEFDDTVDVVILERKGEPDSSTYDGTYTMTGGRYFELIANYLGCETDKVNIEAYIDGPNFKINVVNFCQYETNDGVLEMFSENFGLIDENASSVKYTYEIDGDTLNLTYIDTGEKEVYSRVKE